MEYFLSVGKKGMKGSDITWQVDSNIEVESLRSFYLQSLWLPIQSFIAFDLWFLAINDENQET